MVLTPTWNINTSNIWFSQLLCDTTGQKLVGLCSGGINNLQVTTVVGYLYLSSDYGKTWASIGVPLENYIITSIAADSTLTYILIAGNINNSTSARLFRYIDLPGVDYRTFNEAAANNGTWTTISCDSTGTYFVAGQSALNGLDYHDIFYGYFDDLNSTQRGTTYSISDSQPSLINSGPNWDLIKMSSDGLSIFAIANNRSYSGGILYSIDSGSSNIPTFTTINPNLLWGEHNAISLISYNDGTKNVFIVLDDNQQYHKIAVSNEGINNFDTTEPAGVLDGANFTSISCDSTGQYILLCDTYNDRVHFSDGGVIFLQTTPTDGSPGAWQASLALISPNHLAGFFSVNNAGLSAFLLSVPCFTAGSLILTPDGYKNVEDFKDGDDVLTSDGKVVPVNVYTTTLVTTVETAPYRILANTFEEGVPKNNLCLSPYHAIKIGKDMWQVPVRAAEIYKSKISQYDVGKEITYYHLETPNYMSDHLICDGTVVESYAGDQMINKNKNIYAYQPLLLAYNRMNLSQPIMI